jgi:hypothetical protein
LPGDLSDNARCLARIRAGLPTKEQHAPIVVEPVHGPADQRPLQRDAGLNIAGVYVRLDVKSMDRMWTLYMRMYEVLWNLPRGSLAKGRIDNRLNFDAVLGARLIRSYAKEWLDGCGRFACLCLPYLIDDDDAKSLKRAAGRWHDTQDAGKGGVPDGLSEIDAQEKEGAIHPSEDPDLSGLDAERGAATPGAPGEGSSSDGREKVGGHKSMKQYREPFEYADVLKAAGVTAPQDKLIARYYPRTRAAAPREISREGKPDGDRSASRGVGRMGRWPAAGGRRLARHRHRQPARRAGNHDTPAPSSAPAPAPHPRERRSICTWASTVPARWATPRITFRTRCWPARSSPCRRCARDRR